MVGEQLGQRAHARQLLLVVAGAGVVPVVRLGRVRYLVGRGVVRGRVVIIIVVIVVVMMRLRQSRQVQVLPAFVQLVRHRHHRPQQRAQEDDQQGRRREADGSAVELEHKPTKVNPCTYFLPCR